LHFLPTHKAKQKNAKELPSQRTSTRLTMNETTTTDRRAACNSTYKKLAVQWLNEALCPPVADSVVADSFVLPCLPVGREIANFL
jgi:hypothetical protein